MNWSKDEQEFANSRLALRDKLNNVKDDKTMDIGKHRSRDGWNTEPKTTRPQGVTQEQGPRSMIRCILPVPMSGINVFPGLRMYLCRIAGGYTEYNSRGGWINENQLIQTEQSITFEVSFPANAITSEQVIQAFQDAGREQGEVWTHIEYWPEAFQARHTRTN